MVSFLGLVPSIVQIGPARLKVFSLGSVCTHPDYRGRGYAGKILKEVIRHADRADASLLLVSGTRSLYTRENCHLFGDVQRYTMDPTAARHILDNRSRPNMRFRELQATDWLNLVEVARLRTAHFEQSVWDLAALVEAEAFASVNKHHHKLLIAEADGNITGFIIIGVPYAQKERPVVYEWAGEDPFIPVLMAYAVRRFDLTSLDIPIPCHEQTLIQEMTSLSFRKERNLGTVKVIRPERLVTQLSPYLQMQNAELTDRFEVRLADEDHVALRLDKDNLLLNSDEFVSIVFDKKPKVKLDDRIERLLKTVFPIPFPYTAGLNYV